MTDPACSAAFPTIGSKIKLMKLTEIFQESDAAWLREAVYSSNFFVFMKKKGYRK